MLAAALTAAGMSGRHAVFAEAATLPAAAAAMECEGNACAQVTLTFDEAKGQYRAQNNSPDRWARVTASNVASAASVCLAPGKAAYLSLKSIVGPYRASFAPVRCGEEDPAGAPPGAE